jgi:hypothetical protein
VRRNVRSNGYDTPSLPPTHLPSGDWINVSLSIGERGAPAQSFMPFPNEDNYFPRSQKAESGQSSQTGRLGVLRCRAPLQPRTYGANLVEKKTASKIVLDPIVTV